MMMIANLSRVGLIYLQTISDKHALIVTVFMMLCGNSLKMRKGHLLTQSINSTIQQIHKRKSKGECLKSMCNNKECVEIFHFPFLYLPNYLPQCHHNYVTVPMCLACYTAYTNSNFFIDVISAIIFQYC